MPSYCSYSLHEISVNHTKREVLPSGEIHHVLMALWYFIWLESIIHEIKFMLMN